MIKLRHEVPGRMRWHLSDVRQDACLVSRATATLRARPGVQQVRLNPACASLVVHFDPATVTGTQLEAQLRGLLLPRELAAPPGRAMPPSRPVGSDLATLAPRDGPCVAQRPGRRRGLVEILGLRPRIQAPEEPSLLCRVNLRLTRWMLRTSLRALWHEQASAPRPLGGDARIAGPSLSLAWAYDLSQPLLNGPARADTQRRSLARRLTLWWRRGDTALRRLLDASTQGLAARRAGPLRLPSGPRRAGDLSGSL